MMGDSDKNFAREHLKICLQVIVAAPNSRISFAYIVVRIIVDKRIYVFICDFSLWIIRPQRKRI